MAGATLYNKVCGGVDEFSISTWNVVNYFHVTLHKRHATGCHLILRIFRLRTIRIVHTCDVEATVAAFANFKKKSSVLDVGGTGCLLKEIILQNAK